MIGDLSIYIIFLSKLSPSPTIKTMNLLVTCIYSFTVTIYEFVEYILIEQSLLLHSLAQPPLFN